MVADSMRLVYSSKDIQNKILELTREINVCYTDEDNISTNNKPVALCVLKGAAFFFADLIRQVDIEFDIDFIKLSSYGNNAESHGNINIVFDTEIDLKDRDVLIIEDIVDSGYSMAYYKKHCLEKGARSLRIACLIDKVERREIDINVDFAGFKLNNGFVVGYGMDFAEKYRNLPAVYEIISE